MILGRTTRAGQKCVGYMPMGATQKCERWQRTEGTKRRVEPGLCWVMAAVRDVSQDRGSHQGKTSEKIMSG